MMMMMMMKHDVQNWKDSQPAAVCNKKCLQQGHKETCRWCWSSNV